MSAMFNYQGEYKRILREHTELMERTAGSTYRDYRMHVIEQMIDAYIEQVGKRPDGDVLERLTNVVLHEELSDPRPDKMTIEEYPIMSERMYRVRTQGAERKKNKAGVVNYEVPLEQGVNVATDGADYTPHTRSYHNKSPR